MLVRYVYSSVVICLPSLPVDRAARPRDLDVLAAEDLERLLQRLDLLLALAHLARAAGKDPRGARLEIPELHSGLPYAL